MTSIPAFALDQGSDPLRDIVTNEPHSCHRLIRRIVNGPVFPLCAWHNRALITASHGDQPRRVLGEFRREALWPGADQVDTHLPHRRQNLGVDSLARLRPSAFGVRLRRIGQLIEKRGRDLRPSGVVDAGKEDVNHTCDES